MNAIIIQIVAGIQPAGQLSTFILFHRFMIFVGWFWVMCETTVLIVIISTAYCVYERVLKVVYFEKYFRRCFDKRSNLRDDRWRGQITS